MMSQGAIDSLEELRVDSKLCKDRHFAAAERKMRYHHLFGVPIIVINVFLGSILLTAIQKVDSQTWVFAIAPFLAFVAAGLSGLQTFFNFHRVAEGHRRVANRYLEVSSKCKLLIRKNQDIPIQTPDLWKDIKNFRKLYSSVNNDAEAFPTSANDFKKAKDKTPVSPHKAQQVIGREGETATLL